MCAGSYGKGFGSFFLIVCVFLSSGLLLGGYYPITSMEAIGLVPDSCPLGQYVCDGNIDGVTWTCSGEWTSSYKNDFGVGIGVIPFQNYIYYGSPPSSIPCYVNPCSEAFSKQKFYLNNCTLVERNFAAVFQQSDLNAEAYLISGLFFGGILALAGLGFLGYLIYKFGCRWFDGSETDLERQKR
ncbi:MAG: hypothetical protein ACYCQJ_14905 [Nitrososphaerales archaeon]